MPYSHAHTQTLFTQNLLWILLQLKIHMEMTDWFWYSGNQESQKITVEKKKKSNTRGKQWNVVENKKMSWEGGDHWKQLWE